MDRLTATETAMAHLVAGGAGNKEIARVLHVTPKTVQNTLSAVYRVLALPGGMNQRVLLTRLVIEQGRTEGREEGR